MAKDQNRPIVPFPADKAEDLLKLAHAAARRMMKRQKDEDIEDVSQEIVRSALRGYDTFDPDKGKLSTWVNSIASFRVRDFYELQGKTAYERLSEQAEVYKQTPRVGQPIFTSMQRKAIQQIYIRENMSKRAVWRMLKGSKEVRKLLGLKVCPSLGWIFSLLQSADVKEARRRYHEEAISGAEVFPDFEAA